jgi:serine/threonine protein kinase
MPELPEKFGKYHVVGLAGRGNMGVVYLGYDPFAGRDVAIKVSVIKENLENTAARQARKLFFNEAHMAGLLDHPNVLKIFDAGEENGEPYIVMEYVEGGQTLLPYCEPKGLLPIQKVAEIISTCARAIDYAHRQGVIHRDIKPSNIMQTTDGELKIGDFGIAHRPLADTTHVLGIVGSPRYMSPEQVQEDKISGQTDLYSLGVVMFELLTGQPPFAGTNLSRLIYEIAHEAAPSVLDLRPELPATLDDIVNCALAKKPADRYCSGAEFASDLAGLFTELVCQDERMDELDRFGTLRRLPFFSDFSDTNVWEALRSGTWKSFAAGETIVSEGNPDVSLYILIKGVVKVTQGGKVLTTLSSSDCFGELNYVSGAKHLHSIEAATDVSLLQISEAQMSRASELCQLRFHKTFLRNLIGRLAQSSGASLAALSVQSPNYPVAPKPARAASGD